MFKRKRYIRLDEIQGMPKTPELKRLLFESNRARGSTVELPWRSLKTKLRYSITVCFEVDRLDPIWSLYQGEGAQSRMVWTQSFKDPELLNDVISISLPAEAPAEQFPDTNKVNDRDKYWNPHLDRSRHTYTNNEVELLKEPVEALPPKPESDAFFSLPPLEKEEPLPAASSADEFAIAEPAVQEAAPLEAPASPAEHILDQPPQPGQIAASSYPGYAPGYDPNLQGAPQPGYAYPPGYPAPYPPPYGYPYPPQDAAAYAAGYGYPPQGYPGYPPGYLPPDPNAYQPGYPPQYPPGYPMPYPPGYPVPQAGGQYPAPYPGQYGPGPGPGTVVVPRVTADSDLIAKRPNILLGDFLVETGLIPESTLEAALQLQEMVRNGSLSTGQAAEAVRRAHNRGGEVEQFTPSTPNLDGSTTRVNAPPLGEILVEAGLIRVSILKAALNLQEVVRTGALTKEEAIDAFLKEHFGKDETAGDANGKLEKKNQKILELFVKAKLIQQSDIDAAEAVRKKHGGDVPKILEAAGKFDKMTFEAAGVCQKLLGEKRLKIEQAIIALHYCQRSRVSFDDAIEELGWEKP